jgi:copper-binding protein NosD
MPRCVHSTFASSGTIRHACARRIPACVSAAVLAAALVVALPGFAAGATRYVANTGSDGPSCGLDAATACRSITQAIANANPGDTILVGPGRYGDINGNGFLGDIAGEETGSPGCGCMLSLNKNVIVVSSAGAAATIVDARSVDVRTNVLLITAGGEFGRPGKGFLVTDTRSSVTVGIAIDSVNVLIRGNQVIFSRRGDNAVGDGIETFNDEPILIEGNYVANWYTGIAGRGAVIVRKNEVTANVLGILATGGDVVGNVVAQNRDYGIDVGGPTRVLGNAVYAQTTSNGIFVRSGFSGTLTKNNLMGNSCALYNQGSPNLKAPNNYWGSPDGPGFGFNRVCGNPTQFTPVATKPFAVKVLKP